MTIISLNLWGGKLHEELKDFIWKHRAATDIFCFQEVFDTTTSIHEYQGTRPIILREIRRILQGWDYRFSPGTIGEGMDGSADINLLFGLCIFSKKMINQYEDRHIISNKEVSRPLRIAMRRNIQLLTVKHKGINLLIANYHGLWNGGGKGDSSERMHQSNAIRHLLNSSKSKTLLVGDLNLDPSSESLRILKGEMVNLVETHGVQTTRSSHYAKRAEMPIADYALVDPDLQIASFDVLPDEVSDHLALKIVLE